MEQPLNKAHNVVDVLAAHARARPDEIAFVFLERGERERDTLTFGELDAAARRLGAGLARRGWAGARALVLYPTGLDFVTAFYGCLYGGVLPVPAYPPASTRAAARLRVLVEDAQPALVLAPKQITERCRDAVGAPPGSAPAGPEWPTWIELAEVEAAAADFAPKIARGAPAFLQYTSGSTRTPRGVVVSHDNLVHNERMIRDGFDAGPDDILVSWLPLYHDMGLIGQMMLAASVGARCYLMSPEAFLERPARWLEAIARLGATIAGGPNFAYELCARKIDETARAGLDLGRWRVAFNGAEPVRADTLDRFARQFAPCGFRREALYPCYGLAEATLMVSGGDSRALSITLDIDAEALERGEAQPAPAASRRHATFVSCGRSRGGHEIQIVDAGAATALPPGRVGEIWLHGPCVAQGYFRSLEATRETFGGELAGLPGRRFLRTGDLGFVRDGQLYITGRKKDLLIVRGRNLYPQDLEATALHAAAAELRPGCVVACGIDVDGEEVVALVAELKAGLPASPSEVLRRIRETVAAEHAVALARVILTSPGEIPKTSSGKIQRRACRDKLVANQLGILAEIAGGRGAEPARAPAPHAAAPHSRAAVLALPVAGRQAGVLLLLQDFATRTLRVSPLALAGNPSFAELGLDSLGAAELKLFLEQELGVELGFGELLAGPTLAELAARAVAALSGPGSVPAPPGQPAVAGGGQIDEHVEAAASTAIARIWFEQELIGPSPVYNMVGSVCLSGPLDAGRLALAIARSADRHLMLRACVEAHEGRPRPRFVPVDTPLPVVDLSALAGPDQAAIEARLIEETSGRAFDLCAAPLFRLHLVRRAATRHELVLVAHHLVADGWSMGVLLGEWAQAYAGATLPPAPSQGELVAEARRSEVSEGRRRSLAYWREQLRGLDPSLALPYDRPRSNASLATTSTIDCSLDRAVAATVRAFVAERGGTVHSVLLAAFVALLHRVSDARDISVGVPFANRASALARGAVGPLVNPLVVRTRIAPDAAFAALHDAVKHALFDALQHGDVPIDALAREIAIARDGTASPFFRVMFALESYPLPRAAAGELAFDARILRDGGPAFDLTLSLREHDGAYTGRLAFNGSIFERTTAVRIAAQYALLLGAVLRDATAPLSRLGLFDAHTRAQLTYEWAGYEADRGTQLAHQAFEQRAAEAPDALAVLAAGHAVTYRELDRRAGAVAAVLSDLGCGPGTLVACLVDRGVHFAEAMLGAFKAGAAVLPIDSRVPMERRRRLLEDSGARIVLAGPGATDLGTGAGSHVVDLAALPPRPPPRRSVIDPEAPAYVIYTSGSTGTPNGVVVPHAALASLLSAARRVYGLGPGDRVLHFASPVFDVAFEEVLPTLAAGACVVAPASDEIHGLHLEALIARLGITVVNLPAQYWQRWGKEIEWASADLASLRLVVAGSEAVSADALLRWRAHTPSEQAWLHAYGVTEATITSTYHVAGARPPAPGPLPIGRPFGGTRVHVLDAEGEPAALGSDGEAAVSGARVARGYLSRPALTARRFGPDRLSPAAGARRYATGDVVKRLAGGELLYRGRRDLQVKVTGQRIELGEIEAALVEQPGIMEAACSTGASPSGGERILAHVVLSAPAATSLAELGSRLAERLPRAMLPVLVPVERLPRLPGGKIDRRALPAPAAVSAPGDPPADPVEEAIAELWKQLLGAAVVSRADNFFALGGHSLDALQLVARVRARFGVDLPVRTVFEAQTVAELAMRVRRARRDASAAAVAVAPAAAPDGRASPAEQRLFILQRLQPGSAAYNVPIAMAITGPLSASALAGACDALALTHASLRTRFELGPAGLTTGVVTELEPAAIVDLSGLEPSDRAATGRALTELSALRPFDLGAGRLLRLCLFRIGPTDHHCLITTHHIAADGASLPVLLEDLGAFYDAHRAGRPAALAGSPPEASAGRRPIEPGEHRRGLAFWRRTLAALPPEQPLATDRPRPPVPSGRGAACRRALDTALLEAMAALAASEGATPFMLLLAAYFELGRRSTDKGDQWVGTAIRDGDPGDGERAVGLYLNSVVIRASVDGAGSFRDLVRRVRSAVLDAVDHGDVPFDLVVDALQHERKPGQTPLFQVMCLGHTRPLEPPRLPDLRVRLGTLDRRCPKFDLTIELDASRHVLEIEYAEDLFDRATAARLLGEIAALLAAAVSAPDAPLGRLPVIAARAAHQQAIEWNDSRRAGPAASVIALAERQAASSPDAIAVSDPELGIRLTFADWERRSRAAACDLGALGVAAGSPITVFARRSSDLVIAVSAVARAGGTFVAIDPDTPAERLAGLVEDAGVHLAVCDPGSREAAAAAGLATYTVDVRAELPAIVPALPPRRERPQDPAYLLFTSGSTGRPKAALNTHAGFANRLEWMRRALHVGAGDRILHKTPFTFDVSLWELFLPLISGAELVVAAAGRHHDPRYLADTVARERITIVHFVPSMLRSFLAEVEGRGGPATARLESLRIVIASGEALPRDVAARLCAQVPAELHNLYGPTEAAIDVTAWVYRSAGQTPPAGPVSIGRPIDNAVALLLSRDGELERQGTPCELLLGGDALGLGYANRPATTARSFPPSPRGAGDRLYRTGDLARRMADGCIEFLGRIDSQVKLRGMRIELGEIEAALLEVAPIREAVVKVIDPGTDAARLAAWVVPRARLDLDLDEVRSALARRLPGYMVPGLLSVATELPRTASGKLDRSRPLALGAPSATEPAADAPRGATEMLIASVWRDLLGVETIHRDSNFFRLGGQSLLATQAALRLERALGRPVPLATIFETQSLRDLAARLADSAAAPGDGTDLELDLDLGLDLDLDLGTGPTDALSAQERRTLFLEDLLPGTSTYVMSGALSLSGPLELAALEAALASLVAGHGSLRTIFPRVEGAASPRVLSDSRPALAVVETTRAQLPVLARLEANRPFDLERGPLLRLRLFRIAADDHVLVLAVHHAVCDGWSLGLMLSRLAAAYAAARRGAPPPTSAEQTTYRQYAAAQQRWLASGGAEPELAYWMDQLAGDPPALRLPVDRPHPRERSGRGGSVSAELSAPLVAAVRELSRAEDVTVFAYLAAVLAVLLHRAFGADDAWIGTVVHNRDRARLHDTVGLFANTVVLRMPVAPADRFLALLGRSRSVCREALAHQRAPFELVVERQNPRRDLAATPLFQVMLAMQDGPEVDAELDGLTVRRHRPPAASARCDLTLLVDWRRREIELEHNTDVIDGSTARRILGWYLDLAGGIARNPHRPIGGYEFGAPGERAWNQQASLVGSSADDQAPTIPQRFERSAARWSGAPAVTDSEATLTYGELGDKVQRIAASLSALGVGPKTVVAVVLPRSWRALAAMLGVLRAGGAYLAIGPAHPASRVRGTLEDAGASIAIVDDAGHAGVPAGTQGLAFAALVSAPAAPPSSFPAPSDLAYIIYTSGSTGRPKGVALRHAGASALLQWSEDTFGASGLRRMLAATSFAFDLSVFELFAPLCTGGHVTIVPNLLEARRVAAAAHVTLVNTVPSLAREALATGAFDFSGKLVNLAGEALAGDLVAALSAAGARAIWNAYGPTEDTTYSTAAHVVTGERPAIGRPVTGGGAAVLDGDGALVPPGACGELWLHGIGLAAGYLDRAPLTARTFVPWPGAGQTGARAYRTGDAARFHSSGSLEFLGRIDRQVKLRGFRIEPAEVEAALESDPAVRHAAVDIVADDRGEPQLVAWIVLGGGAGHDLDLRAHLAPSLPAPLVPSRYVFLDEMPRLPSGKIDRKALPRKGPTVERTIDRPLDPPLAPPRTPTEAIVADVWRDVLGGGEVGAETNFFDAGGHSLRAIRVAAVLAARLGVDVALRDLFSTQTLAELAHLLDSRPPITGSWLDDTDANQELGCLSLAQERMWMLQQLDPEAPIYNLCGALTIDGALSVAALSSALLELGRRHQVLRTVCAREAGGLRARLCDAAPPLAVVDLRGTAVDLPGLLRGEAARPFDLERGPLLRTALFVETDERHHLVIAVHHIVADGRSLDVIARELASLYERFCAGTPSASAEPPVSYAQVAARQRRWLSSGGAAAQHRHWRAVLSPDPPPLDLPVDRPHPARRSNTGGRCSLRLPPDLVRNIAALAAGARATPFMVLAASLFAFLHRSTERRDLRIGTAAADRQHAALQDMVGLLINTVVLAIEIDPDRSFEHLLGEVRRVVLDAHENRALPFEQVVELLAPDRRPGHTPLFQVALMFQDTPPPAPRFGRNASPWLELVPGVSKFDLTFIVETAGAAGTCPWVAELEYNADVFTATTARRLLGDWLEVLAACVANPTRRIAAAPLLSPREARQLVDFGHGPDEHPGLASGAPSSAIDPFLTTAARQPDDLAVTDGATALSYRDLDARTLRLARILVELGVGPGTPVGIRLNRTVDMVVATLAVVRAGGVYVALDPAYPEERLRLIRDDGDIEIVLGEPLGEVEARKLGPGAGRLPRIGPDDLVYVTYTSGSTGRPRGVAVRHRGVLALIEWARARYDREQMRCVLASTSLGFDLSVYEIFATLAIGGSIAVTDHALDPWRSCEHPLSLVNTVPSSGREMLEQGLVPPGLAVANFCGEPLPRALCDRLFELGVQEVWNLYGPCEDTTYSTAHRVLAGELGPPAIGRPIHGSWAQVVDGDGRVCALGQSGGLQLGGAGLARGYVGRPAMTAQRFTAAPGGRQYRTGDLVRWRSDGQLAFLGRADNQVKVRGFRVEPGEIESLLEDDPRVAQAIVLPDARPAAEQLYAYVIPREGPLPAEDELLGALRQRLPRHMVPARLLVVHDPPRLPNGKIDRQRLPRPDAPPPRPEARRAEPSTELLLATIWSDLLGQPNIGPPNIGPDDGFFALGGHSLLATRMVARIAQAFGVELPFRCIFDSPTLAALARQIDLARADGAVPLPAVERAPDRGDAPLTWSQERLWLREELAPDAAPLGIGAVLSIAGEIRAVALGDALDEIVRRHEILRTSFGSVDGVPRQRILPATGAPLPVVDFSGLDPAARDRTLELVTRTGPIGALSGGPGAAFRIALLRLDDHAHALAAIVHHVVIDEWSVGILVDELEQLYVAALTGAPSALDELAVQVADVARWQRRHAGDARLERQRAFWAEELSRAHAGTLGLERAASARVGGRAGCLQLRWPSTLADEVIAFGRRESLTPFMALVAGLAVTVKRYSGRDRFVIGTPVAGRGRAELDGLIGFFVNEIVLAIDLSGAATVKDACAAVRRTILDAFAHQDLPFGEALALARGRVRGDGPLIGVHFDLHPPRHARSEFAGLPLQARDLPPTVAQFPLQLSVQLEDGAYQILAAFDTGAIDREDAGRFCDDFQTAVHQITGGPSAPVESVLAVGRWRERQAASDAAEEFQF